MLYSGTESITQQPSPGQCAVTGSFSPRRERIQGLMWEPSVQGRVQGLRGGSSVAAWSEGSRGLRVEGWPKGAFQV